MLFTKVFYPVFRILSVLSRWCKYHTLYRLLNKILSAGFSVRKSILLYIVQKKKNESIAFVLQGYGLLNWLLWCYSLDSQSTTVLVLSRLFSLLSTLNYIMNFKLHFYFTPRDFARRLLRGSLSWCLNHRLLCYKPTHYLLHWVLLETGFKEI